MSSEREDRFNEVSTKTGHGGPGLEPSYPVGCALSGGGVRAALFGLGVLMAMHDADKMPRDIVSVSGGSITNMMLAEHYSAIVATTRENPDHVWEIATQRTFNAIRAGSLTDLWLFVILACMFLPLLMLTALTFNQTIAWPVALLALCFWALLILCRGMFIEFLMANRYLGSSGRRHSLANLSAGEQQHLFCATDIVLGYPVYFSSKSGVFRRTADRRGGKAPLTLAFGVAGGQSSTLGIQDSSSSIRLPAVLRATAAFPGIPPRLFRWATTSVKGKPGLGLLSDGGIWNNLATEPFHDDVVRGEYGPWVVLVADGSGSVAPVSARQFLVPFWCEIRSLLRAVTLLSTNTVAPRRGAYDDDLFLELRSPGSLRFASDRIFAVVPISDTPAALCERFRRNVDREVPDTLRYQKTGSGIPERYVTVRERIDEIARTEVLKNFERWSIIASEEGAIDAVATYPTTLGRVTPRIATALVLRGYSNAALTLYLTNLCDRLPTPGGWLAESLGHSP